MLDTILPYVVTTVCITLTLIATLIATYLLWLSTHWRRKGVLTYGNPISGIFTDSFRQKKSLAICLREMYQKSGKAKFYGTFLFGQPLLVLHDRDIKKVLIKDYNNFSSHGVYYDAKKDPLSANLFNLAADEWKFMRSKLSPTFSSGKLKITFNTLQECISTLHKAIEKERLRHNDIVDVRELLACLTTDTISSVAFGIEANSFDKVNAVFTKMGRKHFSAGLFRFLAFLMSMNPTYVKYFPSHTSESAVNRFLLDAFCDTVNYREKNNVTRNDFMNLLIQLRQQTNSERSGTGRIITLEDIAAQSFIFFAAGFETTASTLSYFCLEMAKNPEIQRKVQEECDKVLKASGGTVSYDVIRTMEYSEKVVQETLRFYPPLPILLRAVTKSCELPTTGMVLEKDTLLWVPLTALHMNEDVFPDPFKFDPSRFNKEIKDNIPPYAYMPFGEGPRICIGMRYAMVQVRAVILQLFSRYNIELSDEVNPNPEFRTTNVLLVPNEGFKLKLTPRANS